MDFYKTTFDTYEVISLSNVYVGDDSFVEAIKVNIIVVEVIGKDIRKCFVLNCLPYPKL